MYNPDKRRTADVFDPDTTHYYREYERRRHKLGTGELRSQGTVIGLSLDRAMLMNLACHYLNCS